MTEAVASYTDEDDKFFLVVARELAVGRKDEALWTRAFAENNGDNAKSKAAYICMRVSKLRGTATPSTPCQDTVTSEPAISDPVAPKEETPGAAWTPPIVMGVVCAFIFGLAGAVAMLGTYAAIKQNVPKWAALSISLAVGVASSLLITFYGYPK